MTTKKKGAPLIIPRAKLEGTRLKALFQAFPQVQTVSDATESVRITVLPADAKEGAQKDAGHCALARAACRELHADGAFVRIGYSYIVRGTHATRYNTSELVARELTSFDRSKVFAPGTYVLRSIPPLGRLGMGTRGKDVGKKKYRKHPGVRLQHTAGVRNWEGRA